MTNIYFFFKSIINVFWLGVTVIILSELYVYAMNYPKPAWLTILEGCYYGLWTAFRLLTNHAFG